MLRIGQELECGAAMPVLLERKAMTVAASVGGIETEPGEGARLGKGLGLGLKSLAAFCADAAQGDALAASGRWSALVRPQAPTDTPPAR